MVCRVLRSKKKKLAGTSEHDAKKGDKLWVVVDGWITMDGWSTITVSMK
jgi:hypothetical protein